MDPAVEIAAEQLARMRGMTALYHRRFFADIRFSLLVILGLFTAAAFGAELVVAAVPFVALLGATQTAFDASYLIFARQYAARLEGWINQRLDTGVLVAARLEDTYLFPLDRRKVVTLAFGSGFSWFGFMTAFYTLLGAAAYLVGMVIGLEVLEGYGGWYDAFAWGLGMFTVAALGVGAWWFVGGVGERRLRTVLDETFGA